MEEGDPGVARPAMHARPMGYPELALPLQQATAIATEVADVVDGWQAHFERCGVSPHDCRLLAQQVDRPFLLAQRRF